MAQNRRILDFNFSAESLVLDGAAFDAFTAATKGYVVESGAPIWDVIRHAREEEGLSQRELAENLAVLSGNSSITRDDVKRWESGKRIPRPRWRYWLSRALHIPAELLETAARIARVHRARRNQRESGDT
ncbi:helix-turn-helix domain-containing protein [Phytoactinopolyspora limicola]|uniref:helix-turn-helix domain-containing protein n=1 Tax=Phytoactinopolyspora limicola TaxID=2715536 RepID=UPI00140D6955|nr:helix-turn-helix transcriptional regulator [Phytoactinopolyspora limicola]